MGANLTARRGTEACVQDMDQSDSSADGSSEGSDNEDLNEQQERADRFDSMDARLAANVEDDSTSAPFSPPSRAHVEMSPSNMSDDFQELPSRLKKSQSF